MKTAIGRILVPIDPSIFTGAATETACRIALKHDAEVAGVAVLDSVEIRSSLVPSVGPYYPMMIEAVSQKVSHAERILTECKARFAMTCEEYDVRHIETEYEGVPVQMLLASSIFFDLIVTGHETAFHFETRGERGNSLAELLDTTVTPILAVPAMGMLQMQEVLIAFDGSLSSARALHDFTQLAQRYSPQVKVLTAREKGVQSKFLLRNAKEYLNAHGITQVETIESDSPVDEAVDAVIDENIDLVVAGIHSKRPVRERFTGSLARHLIEKGAKALFLSH